MHRPVRSILLLVLLLSASGAWAETGQRAQPKFVASYRDWAVFTYQDGNKLVCYIASEPVKKEGNYSRRGPAAVLVARFPMPPPNIQLSVQSGYRYKDKSEVELKIGNRTFSLFTDGESAFARNAEEDERIIAAMKAGTAMTAKGTSQRGTWSLDTYSLLGFTAAYEAMLNACKNQ